MSNFWREIKSSTPCHFDEQSEEKSFSLIALRFLTALLMTYRLDTFAARTTRRPFIIGYRVILRSKMYRDGLLLMMISFRLVIASKKKTPFLGVLEMTNIRELLFRKSLRRNLYLKRFSNLSQINHFLHIRKSSCLYSIIINSRGYIIRFPFYRIFSG